MNKESEKHSMPRPADKQSCRSECEQPFQPKEKASEVARVPNAVAEKVKLKGPRWEIHYGCQGYPDNLLHVKEPPECLYGIGNAEVLQDGLAIVGARKATPYGKSLAKKFAILAAEQGITVISGGAFGCDSQAHKGTLQALGKTVVVLGGGCDQIYPKSNTGLFQNVIDSGGAVISEHPWEYPALPHQFRARNRIIAGLARATLIVEAGLPSGTFSTADEALEAGREVWAVPGAITSATSKGANRLIYQGATPIVDEECFLDVLESMFGLLCLRTQNAQSAAAAKQDALLNALLAEPLRLEELYTLNIQPEGSYDSRSWIIVHLAELERDGLIARFPDGRYGPAKT